MNYKDIVKLFFLPENEELIPDGTAYSEAMCEIKDGKLLDSFFLYTVTDNRSEAVGPIAKISLDASTGSVVDYCEYENPRKFSLKNNYDEEIVITALEDYETIYPILREIYFKGKYDDCTKELLLRVLNDISIFANDDMINIYYQLFPVTIKFLIDNSK